MIVKKPWLIDGLIIINLITGMILIFLVVQNSEFVNQIQNAKDSQASYETSLSTCNSNLITVGWQINSCNYTAKNADSEIKTLQNNYSFCQSQLDSLNSQQSACSNTLSSFSSQLSSCTAQLSSYTSSYCGIYSQHMHSSDVNIQTAAVSAKIDMENYVSNWMNMFSRRYQIASSCSSKLSNVPYTKLIGAMGSYYWIVDNVEYINTPLSTSMRDDTTVLQVKSGQCNEQALLLASMLRSQGIRANIIHLDVPAPYCTGGCGHAITIAYIDGLTSCQPGWSWGTDTVLLDPTFKGEFGAISYMSTSVQLTLEKLVDIPSSLR